MFKCNFCNREFSTKKGLKSHSTQIHGVSLVQYKYCEKCNIKLSKNNNSGFCNKCRDRTGKNNPFYGKKHSDVTICKLKLKGKKTSEQMWQNDEYRNKVIKNSSKPRSEQAKKNISKAVKLWYDSNPQQKEIRKEKMIKMWESEKIIKNNILHSSKSKLEKEFFNMLNEYWGGLLLENQTIIINNKWYFPDILIEKYRIIIEFFGDYWHANPEVYNESSYISKNSLPMKEIHDIDFNRIKKLKEENYIVLIVWERDFKENKENIVLNVSNMLEELCNI